MTLAKAWVLIFIGMMSLTAILSLALVSTQADGTAYSLVFALVLSVGGFANFLAVRRYGSANHRHR